MTRFRVLHHVFAMLAAVLATLGLLGSTSVVTNCEFQAIFNFGDSNSDTGGFWAAFPAQSAPFGMTYFKRPAGRASDGRVIIDFLAQGIGIPFLSPYLQSIGSNFQHGANYATLASTVLMPNTSLFVSGVSPIFLAIQVNQMKAFKAKVDEASSSSGQLPAPDIFGKSLYVFYIGQNDFTGNLARIGISGVQQYLPQVVAQIDASIKEIYNLGGRSILVFNIGPIGCYPAFIVGLPHTDSDFDESGCLVSYNNAVVSYNNMLKDKLAETRKSIPDASVIYVDIHSIILELFRHPKDHGLIYGPKACCGHGGGKYNFNPQVVCGNSKEINGKIVKAEACGDPQNYVSWDGTHTTDAANRLIAQAILSGSYFDPPFELNKRCDIQPIGYVRC